MRPILPSLLFAAVTATAAAQSPAPASGAERKIAETIGAWISLDVAPGREADAAARLARALPGWSADARGNLVRRVGRGSPRRVVACALDIPQFVVSQITDEGYLRLHRAGGAPTHPLWDQFHEAQRIKVMTATGEIPGVVAVANGHFARQHRADTTVVWVDQLWVDVGAASRAQAEALGVALLDPVLADRPVWEYEGFAAGPAAGARASCAAVATAAGGAVQTGETVYVLSTQRAFGWAGLAGVLARLGAIDALTLVDAGRASATNSMVPVSGVGAAAVARVTALDSARVVAPRVRFAGSFVESVHADDARALLDAVVSAASASSGSDAVWVGPPPEAATSRTPRGDAFAGAERQIMKLLDLPGVPGHEWQVRNAIRAALPEWAAERAVVDSIGNLIVAAGPDRDSVLFMAHMDEVAFEVERIAADGTISLARRGGAVLATWEGQTALLHFDPDATGRAADALRGVIIPRETARVKSPAALTAWFGLDSAQLVARGVKVGMGVTSYKSAGRLAGTRITGRGSDDRTGSTALLLALNRIDPATLARKVIFAWSVGEEGGLVGARYFAKQHGASLSRVYSIDTFVSSETPLELPTFAFTPLGKGPVLRGLDDGAMSPKSELDRVKRVARASGIPLQVGTTHGATDGSAMVPYGAPNTGLSWPGRYSHTPGEVLDLRDLDALARLIAAMARER